MAATTHNSATSLFVNRETLWDIRINGMPNSLKLNAFAALFSLQDHDHELLPVQIALVVELCHVPSAGTLNSSKVPENLFQHERMRHVPPKKG